MDSIGIQDLVYKNRKKRENYYYTFIKVKRAWVVKATCTSKNIISSYLKAQPSFSSAVPLEVMSMARRNSLKSM